MLRSDKIQDPRRPSVDKQTNSLVMPYAGSRSTQTLHLCAARKDASIYTFSTISHLNRNILFKHNDLKAMKRYRSVLRLAR